MGKLAMVVMLISLVVAMAIVDCSVEEPREIDEWFNTVRFAKEKMTKLHFYFHDILGGKHPTAMQVAQASNTAQSPTAFGFVAMMDDPLTEGPELTSKQVGRAQGIYGSAAQQEVGLLMALNFLFTSGKYNGSTLSILARNPTLHPIREMPIVGGSGVFRLARGLARAKTYYFNITPISVAIVEYNLWVIHY